MSSQQVGWIPPKVPSDILTGRFNVSRLKAAVFSQANISIFAKMASVLIPFHLNGPADACGNYGLNCPVKVGEKDQIKISLPIQKFYPSIKTTVRFELNDEKANPIVCFEFPVELVKASSF